MNESHPIGTCSRCGATVAPGALQGLCPRCLIALNLATQTEVSGDGVGPNGTRVVKPSPAPAPASEEIAKLFPQFEILECLGRGGMGAVYKARQPKLDRFVALKILLRERQGDSLFAERFAREARALARLNHPDIVAVHEFGEAGGYSYLVMEYVDGLSLRQLLQRGKLAPEEALALVPKICAALEFAHQRGIVHRDIKPENLLLDKQGQVKIADFGIAKILVPGAQDLSLTGGKDVVGTPHYMAPEQIEQPTKVDHRADIFSLGVVFYEMLTGELPLGKFQPPSRKVQVDVRLDEVVLHALEKEPERRYQHASEVKTAVETITRTTAPSSVAAGAGPAGTGEAAALPQAQSLPPGDSVSRRRALKVCRWTARLLSVLLLAFYGMFVLAEGLPPIGNEPEGVQLNFAAQGLMLLGFVIGWKREGWAALLIACGWTLWHIAEGRIAWNFFQTPLPVAGLYAFCWWATGGRRTKIIAGTAAALAVALGLGRLVCPANVFIDGVVTDGATGRPITNAEIWLPQPTPPGIEARKYSRALSNRTGHFTLYIGWYVAGKQISVSAPGYAPLSTNLGARPIGQRRLTRDFRLQPTTSVGAESFGPIIERVVYRSEPDSEIDLDHAKLGQVPREILRDSERGSLYTNLRNWRIRNGFDGAGFNEQGQSIPPDVIQARAALLARAGFTNAAALYSGLNVFDMGVSRVANEQWERMSPTAVSSAVSSISSNEGDVVGAPNNGEPTTWLFKTREGGMGLLQILGPADQPRVGVKIQYKLVQIDTLDRH